MVPLLFNYELKDLNSVILCSEKITQEQLKSIADKALHGLLIVKNGIPEIPHTNGSVDWNYNTPILPDTAQFLLQGLTSIMFLAKAYECFREDSYLNLAKRLFYDWYAYQNDAEISQNNSYVWNDHAVAIRTEYLIYFLLLCSKDKKLSDDLYKKICEVLILQGRWLNDEQNYFPNCNHGIFADYSLICLAKLWTTDESQQWFDTAKKRLWEQYQFAFTDEMVHVENSPGYHLMVIELFERIARFLKRFGDNDGEVLYQNVKKSKEFLTWMIKPTGYLADIGDTDGERDGRYNYNDVIDDRICLDKEVGGGGVNEKFRIYPHSGYYFSRRYQGIGSLKEQMWLMFKSGYQSRVHKHGDDLSFMLTSKGYDIFVDTGSYGNKIGDPFVDYLHSSLGHNTVTVDERTYSISNERTYLSGICEYSLNGEVRYIRGFNDGYQNVYIDRAIYEYGEMIFIHDEIQSSDYHTYSQIFHLSEYINIIRQSDKEIIGEIGDTEYVVHIRQLVPTDELYCYKGLQKDNYYGYRSPSMGEIVDCTTLRFEKSGTDIDFITMINIIKKDAVEKPEVHFSLDNMTIMVNKEVDIHLTRRLRPSLNQINCIVNGKEAYLTLADCSNNKAQEYRWELWDAKWGKKFREQSTDYPYCKFEKDFYVDAYIKVSMITNQNQIVKRVVGLLEYQPDTKRHKFIEDGNRHFNLEVKELLMEWKDANTVRFTILYNYDLKSKINWHIYRNGGHYDYIFKINDASIQYQFREPGSYTVIFNIEDMEGEKQFWNYPQIEIDD